ncbi:fibronectin type III domain-containing protein [Kineosporia mesophila]|uniref:fibronectin type III domain-containing protein n=1 Tax=Kineosporia mesophila TaxID=566012 RepID=UPI001E4E4A6C|nr:fibronectin type III domain-containing protein [Kineosporia mesophila]
MSTAGVAFATGPLDQLALLAGGGSSVPTTSPQSASAVAFDYLRSIAVDAAGNIYVADSNHNQVQRITPAGQVVTFAGDGNQSGSANAAPSGLATLATFSAPEGVAVDSTGNVYISAPTTNRVLKVDTSGQIGVFAGTGSTVSSGGLATPGSATATAIAGPTALAMDADDNLYITDVNSGVYKVTPSGTLSIVTSGVGLGTGLAVDPTGNVYVAYHSQDIVDEVSPAGVVTTVVGSGQSGSSLPASGPATSADLDGPYGVALDASGNLYVSQDGGNNGVTALYRVDPAHHLSVIAGTGTAGSPTLGGPAISSDLGEPTGVVIDSSGQLIFADANENSVYGVQLNLPPAAPTGLSAAAGNASATVTFTAPAGNGGTTVTGYQVSNDAGATWHTLAYTSSGLTITGALSGLVNGYTYAIQVRAVNAVGAGAASATVSVTPAAPAPPPTSPPSVSHPAPLPAPTAVASTSSTTVSWVASASANVTGYTVTAHPGPATCTTTATVTSCVLGAVAGIRTTYTVVVNSAAGDSDPSPPSDAVQASAPTVPETAPDPSVPTTLTTSDGQLKLVEPGQQVVVLGTGFAAYSSASVVIYSTPIVLATVTTDSQGNLQAPVTVPSSLASGQHVFLASGTDPDGRVHQLQLPITVSRSTHSVAAPTDVKVAPVADPRGEGARGATVTFTPPAVHGSGTVRYQVSTDNGRRWTTTSTTGTGRRRISLRQLTADKTYKVRVRAVVTAGSDRVVGRASAAALLRLRRGWYRDPLSHQERAALVPVPTHPQDHRGARANTTATYRSQGGTLVVPASWVKGHRLSPRQGVVLTGDGRFAFDSAVITPAGTAQLKLVAAGLKTARRITCEGYTDYAGARGHELALSRRRALAVCSALQSFGAHTATKIAAYGPDRPVVIGGLAQNRASNRRVIILVTR